MAKELGFEEFVDVISLTKSGNMSYSRYSGKQSYIFYAENSERDLENPRDF